MPARISSSWVSRLAAATISSDRFAQADATAVLNALVEERKAESQVVH